MKNEALTNARKSIAGILLELRDAADHNQPMYHDIFLSMLDIQKRLHNTLKLLQQAQQQTERPL